MSSAKFSSKITLSFYLQPFDSSFTVSHNIAKMKTTEEKRYKTALQTANVFLWFCEFFHALSLSSPDCVSMLCLKVFFFRSLSKAAKHKQEKWCFYAINIVDDETSRRTNQKWCIIQLNSMDEKTLRFTIEKTENNLRSSKVSSGSKFFKLIMWMGKINELPTCESFGALFFNCLISRKKQFWIINLNFSIEDSLTIECGHLVARRSTKML